MRLWELHRPELAAPWRCSACSRISRGRHEGGSSGYLLIHPDDAVGAALRLPADSDDRPAVELGIVMGLPHRRFCSLACLQSYAITSSTTVRQVIVEGTAVNRLWAHIVAQVVGPVRRAVGDNWSRFYYWMERS